MPPSPEDSQSLEETLQQAAGGDERAWRSIIEQFSHRVFGYLRANCGDPELAEEIAQSVFCTVVKKLPEYTELGKFEQWLFRIAMNRLRDEMRRRKRHAIPMEQPTLTALAGASQETVAGPDESGHLAALQRAMNQLSPEDQRIVHLRHHGGLSFKQIANLLDQPLGTVLARQHRALKKLRELMEGVNDD